MSESIFSKIKAKLKKSSPVNEDDLTGEYDLGELEEEYEEEEEDFESEGPGVHPVLAKIKEQLPFLTKLVSKIPRKRRTSNEEYEDEDEGDESVDLVDEKTSSGPKIHQLNKLSGGDDEAQEFSESRPDQVKAKLKNIQNKFKGDLGGKLPFLSKLLNKGKSEEDEDLENEDSTAIYEETPKKKFKMIHALIVLALVVGLASEFMPTEEESTITETPAPTKKRPKVKRQVPVVKEAEPKTAEETPSVEVEVESKDTEIEETNIDETKTADGSDIDTNIKNTTQQDQLEDIFPDDDLDSPSDDDSVEDQIDKTAEADRNNEPPASDEDVDYSGGDDYLKLSGPELEDSVGSNENVGNDEKEDTGIPEDINGDIGYNPKGTVDLTGDLGLGDKLSNQILSDLEKQMKEQKAKREKGQVALPTDPPDYENLGRGLVYNCQGLHWACINKISFDECHKNNQWNKQQSKNIECVPVQVYSDTEDCQVVQQYKIDSVAKTGFCKI